MKKREPRESAFAKQVWKRLDEIPNSWFTTVQQKSLRGLPDIIGCVNCTFVGLELKRNKAEMNKKSGRIMLQKYVMGKIIEAGGAGFFVNPDNLELVVVELMEISRSDQI